MTSVARRPAACSLLVASLVAALAASSTGHAAGRPVGPLPFLASVSKVKIRVEKDSVLVTHVVALPRGEWKSSDIDLYVAHGAPGAPLAIDVRLHRVPDGALEADDADIGESVAYDRAPRAPDTAHPLLGRTRMAGIVAHVREDRFRAAVADGMAELRIRSLHPLPAEDVTHGREVRVRLGAPGGAPLTLGQSSSPRPTRRTTSSARRHGSADRTPRRGSCRSR